jgi:hypothetical protein
VGLASVDGLEQIVSKDFQLREEEAKLKGPRNIVRISG